MAQIKENLRKDPTSSTDGTAETTHCLDPGLAWIWIWGPWAVRFGILTVLKTEPAIPR